MKLYDFYSGFEGEREIRIYNKHECLSIWDGYIDPIFYVMIEIERKYYGKEFGIIKDFNDGTGFSGIEYEVQKINSISMELEAFKKFDISYLQKTQYKNIQKHYIDNILKVVNTLIYLLENSKNNNIDLFIEEC